MIFKNVKFAILLLTDVTHKNISRCFLLRTRKRTYQTEVNFES